MGTILSIGELKMKNEIKRELKEIKKEEKEIKILFKQIFLDILCFIIFKILSIEPKIGVHYLYIVPILTIVFLFLNIKMWKFHIKKIKYLNIEKCYKISNLIMLIFISFICILNIFISTRYIKDIFSEPKEIITNEYRISSNNYLVFMEYEEEIGINISDEYIKKLSINEHISNNTSNNKLYLYKNNIYVKYYPNSNILIDTYILE